MNKINSPVWLEKYRRWQLKVTIDGKRRTFTSSAPGRKGQNECMKKARDAENGLVSASVKVSALYVPFLEDARARTSTGNYTNLESLGRNWILPNVGHKKVSALTEQDMQNVLNLAYTKGKSRKYIRNIRGAFTAFLKYARKCGATLLRPDDLVIPNKAVSGTRSVLNDRDIEKLFSSSTTVYNNTQCEDFYIHAYRLLAVTGLRPSELCELQRKKQNDKNSLAVTGGYNRFGEHTRGKTENAVRTFILPSIGAKILKDQAAMLRSKKIVSPWLFPSEDGDQLNGNSLYRYWKRYEKANGLSDISLYELRHTFVSLCQRTIPEALVKPVIGHSSAMPSYNTYGHQMDGDLELVASMIDAAYTDILGEK